MSSPIADLSYRNYDGPLEAPLHRWWAIATMSMKLAIKKKGFWIWSVLSGYFYLILLAIFYFVDMSAQSAPPNLRGGINPMQQFFSTVVWKDQFLTAFSISQLLLFIVALLVGAGAIANDNRANALLVYLSKPCSKADYILGKWMGVFLLMCGVVAVPTLLFYFYCLLSYRDYGFVSQDPWLILRLLLLIPVTPFFHASVSLGISSMFNQGRVAGAAYAGLYFISFFFTKAMEVIYFITSSKELGGGGGPPAIVKSLYYCSVDGIQIALAKIILATDGSRLIPNGGRGAARGMPGMVPEPSIFIFLPLYFAICGLFLWIAWTRVRAVEVVG